MSVCCAGRFKQYNTCGSAGLERLTTLSDERDNLRLRAIGIFQKKKKNFVEILW
jgi:hypothetical protein